MKMSNGPAASAMAGAGVSAATDVTGFGLLGHLWEMCDASGLGAVIDIYNVPLMNGVLDMVMVGMVPEGAYRNRQHFEARIQPHQFPEARMWPLYDPQTSGGLLMAVPPGEADSLETALTDRDIPAHRIGMFRVQPGIEIVSG